MGGKESKTIQGLKIKRNGELVLHQKYKAFLEEKCPDFAHVRCKITRPIQFLVSESWDAIASGSTPAMKTQGQASPVLYFYDNFYNSLFEVAPEVKPLFRTSVIAQGKALINIIQGIIQGPNTPNAIETVVELAIRHNRYKIKMQYYNVLGCVLLQSLRTCTGETWTSKLDQAWRTVYAFMMTAMCPILYHGIVEPTEEETEMAKRGIYRKDLDHRRISTFPPQKDQVMKSIVPESTEQCPVKHAWTDTSSSSKCTIEPT